VNTCATLPLFPLGTVLFPGGPLRLRIFEPRYLNMVRRCFREHSSFGVVLILEGAEAGAVAAVAHTGTSARLVDFDAQPDGLLGVTGVGEQRFRIVRRWDEADGLCVAEVDYLSEAPAEPVPEEYAYFSDLLREVLPKLGNGYAHVQARYEDAGWVSNRLAEILPLSLLERQDLLELNDPCTRLTQVAAWSARQPTASHV
jgi:uncharacterized protein